MGTPSCTRSVCSLAVNVDGRTARAVRTRRAVVDALLELLAEGDLRPSGERIAERAGVSLRALWANRARQYQIARDELAQLFAAELAAAGPKADELLNALTAVSTWPAWSVL